MALQAVGILNRYPRQSKTNDLQYSYYKTFLAIQTSFCNSFPNIHILRYPFCFEFFLDSLKICWIWVTESKINKMYLVQNVHINIPA